MFRYSVVSVCLIMLVACKPGGKKESIESLFFLDPGFEFNTPAFKKDSGFVYYRVLDANTGDELPIYRLMEKTEAFASR